MPKPDKNAREQKATSVPGDVALDFSQVKPFDPLPETDGDGNQMIYLVNIEKLTRQKSSEGNPMSAAQFSVKKPAEFANRKLFRNFSHLPQALPFLYGLIKAVDPDAELGEGFVYNEMNYQGLDCAVTVVTGQNNRGEPRSDVKSIYPPSKYVEA